MNAFVFKNSNTMKKLVTLILAMSMVAALLVPALMACSAEEVSTPLQHAGAVDDTGVEL